jgi:hypothetical protein
LNRGWAKSINDVGQVVGVYFGGDSWDAFIWDLGNGALNLGPLLGCMSGGGLCSEAWDINIHGQVVGAYRTGPSAEDHPFVWSSTGGKVDIPVADARALTVNDNGVVAGIRGGVGVTPTIWVWTSVDGVRDVDTITETNSYSLWLRINSVGDIVGERDLIDGTTVATLWRHP